MITNLKSFTGRKRGNDHETAENIGQKNQPEDTIHTLHNWGCK